MKLDVWAHKYEHDKKYLICNDYESVNTLIKKQDSLINNLEAISKCFKMDISKIQYNFYHLYE